MGGSKDVCALIRAAESGDVATLTRLLQKGADPNADEHGNTPLRAAAREGQRETIDLLLQAGARVDDELDDYSALDYAFMRGRVAAARRLLDAGARRVPRKKGADTLVHYAVSGGSRELMAMALELFREVDVLGRDHRTALMQACADQPDLVGPLLDRGAEVNAKARFGQTPLSEAAGSGNLALVKELLHRGADVNRGNQSLLAACQGGVGKPFSAQDRVAILGLLLDRGANIEMKDERGYTALMWAAARGESEVGLFLLERGANPKVKSKDGETALDLAKRSKSRALVSRLMV